MERQSGYYWVKYEDEWVVAEWQETPYFKLGFAWSYDGNAFEDSEADGINETRIMPPVDLTPEQIEQERIQKGRADYGVYS
jgi:hypothetical protein